MSKALLNIFCSFLFGICLAQVWHKANSAIFKPRLGYGSSQSWEQNYSVSKFLNLFQTTETSDNVK